MLTLDYLTSALARSGPGPIITASSFSTTERLDAGGALDLEMPATDPRTSLFVPNTLHYLRAYHDGASVGYGIIKQRTKGSTSMALGLRGPNLLGELAHGIVTTATLESAPGSGLPMPAASVLGTLLSGTGWTSTGVPSADVYFKLGDENPLAALTKVAEQLGDHFRQSLTTARLLEWLPTTASGFDAVDSGLRAVEVGSPHALQSNDDVCIVSGGLEEVADGTQRITRIYPRGGGNADARLYITAKTTADPAGYLTVLDANPAYSYIKHTANDAAGSLSAVETFRDIAPIGISATDGISAANGLYLAALKHLQRRLTDQRSYRLTLTKGKQPLLVGTSLHLVCRHFSGTYGWMDINEPVLVLEVKKTYTAAGGDPEVRVQVTV